MMMKGRIGPLKTKKAFVLSAKMESAGYMRPTVRLWLPGGETWASETPGDDLAGRLPKSIPLLRRIAIAYGFKRPGGIFKTLAYDFETFTPGAGPDPMLDRVISAAVWGDKISGCVSYKPPISDDDEKEILEWLTSMTLKVDPDILTGYFSNHYDMPLWMKRCSDLGVALPLGRDGSLPEIVYRQNWGDSRESKMPRFNIKKIEIAGRIHFDVYDEVLYDQSLIGIKSKAMKAVAKFLKIPNIIEAEGRAVSQLPSSSLREYNLSDARINYILAMTYLDNLVDMSERLNIPLNLAVERSPSHISDYFCGRDFLKTDESYEGTNEERYPEIFGKDGKIYQGGFVRAFRIGLFEPVSKIDFVNMYPGIMACGNFDPKTVKLVRIGPYSPAPPKFDGDLITVSDDKIGNVTCRVCLEGESATKERLAEYIKVKAEIKPKVKEDPLARSSYWVIKLILNAASGYHGLRYACWGSVPIIVLTTAIGRWLLTTVCADAENEGLKPVEGDTDGAYINSDKIDVRRYVEKLRSMFPDNWDTKFIDLDLDKYRAGIFTDEKNYVLQGPEGLRFHGAGLMGKHLPPICDKALEAVVESLFSKGDWKERLQGFLYWRNFSVSDFVMSADFKKTDYVDSNLYGQLIGQLRNRGIKVSAGDSVRYVKTIDGYKLAAFAAPDEIDIRYYKKRIADVVARVTLPVQGVRSKEVLAGLA